MHMRRAAKISTIAAFGLVLAALSVAPAAAGLAELIDRTPRAAAPASFLHGSPQQLANRNDPRCKRCARELDRCDENPPYGNERICASNYYECIRRAHVKCD